MPLFDVGLTHHQVSSQVLAHLNSRLDGINEQIKANCPQVRGSIVLATCNRIEIYLDSAVFHPAVDAVTALLTQKSGEYASQVQEALTIHTGEGCAEHLFTVASGLDSMVLGEHEITGQVKRALKCAQHANGRLRRLFNAALTTAKAVVTHTELASAGRSVASVGLDIAERHRSQSLAGCVALVVGTGNFARVVCADLPRRGCHDIWVYSATGRAEQFCQTHAAQPVSMDGLTAAVRNCDVIVCCSAANTVVLPTDLLAEACLQRADVLQIVDLSLGGNLDANAHQLPGVEIINLDAVGQADTYYDQTVEAARNRVREGVETWLHVEEGRQADPAISAMRSHVSDIIEQEIARAAKQYPEEVTKAVARSLHRVSNALLHGPSVRAAELARTGELDDYTHALETLFGIEVPL